MLRVLAVVIVHHVPQHEEFATPVGNIHIKILASPQELHPLKWTGYAVAYDKTIRFSYRAIDILQSTPQ